LANQRKRGESNLGVKNSDEVEKKGSEDLASSLNAEEKEENQPDVEAPKAVDQQDVVSKEEPDSSIGGMEKLKEQLETEKRKSDDLVKQMKYLQADIVNLQRQTDRMLIDVRNQARFSLILELISVKEDLERAVDAAKLNSDNKEDLLEGLKLLITKMENSLRAEDVSDIDVQIGSKLDPRLHEAVSTIISNDHDEGTILSVIGKGYTVNGKVVKPALVEVARRDRKQQANTRETGPKKVEVSISDQEKKEENEN
jgi:molecular chaperone GrpE